VVKVGISDDPVLRLAQLQTGAPFPLRLAYAFVHSDASRIEAMVHRELRAKRAYGEWFCVTEATARDAIYRAAAAIGKPIDGSGLVTPRSIRHFWFILGLSIIVLWALFTILFSLGPKIHGRYGFDVGAPQRLGRVERQVMVDVLGREHGPARAALHAAGARHGDNDAAIAF
jgi:hypothetical protein